MGEERFWTDYVLTKTPPPITNTAAAVEAIRYLPVSEDSVELPEGEALAMLAALDELSTARREAQAEEERLKAELMALIGPASEGTIGGRTAVTLREQTRGETTFRRLHIPRAFVEEVLHA